MSCNGHEVLGERTGRVSDWKRKERFPLTIGFKIMVSRQNLRILKLERCTYVL